MYIKCYVPGCKNQFIQPYFHSCVCHNLHSDSTDDLFALNTSQHRQITVCNILIFTQLLRLHSVTHFSVPSVLHLLSFLILQHHTVGCALVSHHLRAATILHNSLLILPLVINLLCQSMQAKEASVTIAMNTVSLPHQYGLWHILSHSNPMQ